VVNIGITIFCNVIKPNPAKKLEFVLFFAGKNILKNHNIVPPGFCSPVCACPGCCRTGGSRPEIPASEHTRAQTRLAPAPGAALGPAINLMRQFWP
jgi:hypothetical protein